MINQKIFRAYDIRGIYPKEINENNVYFIANKLANFYKGNKKIIVTHDARLSSPVLYRAVVKGLSKNKNLKLIKVGLATTPMLYFLVNYFNAQAGIMVTASHNPPQFNGLKIVGAKAQPVGGKEVLNIINSQPDDKQSFKNSRLSRDYQSKDKTNYFKIYASYLENFINLKVPMKVVFDCSNGPAGRVLERVKNKNLKIKLINNRPDGRFPAHSPDPLKKNSLSNLKKAVINFGADLGVIFDADGDRVFFVDNLGKKVLPDQVAFILGNKFKKIIIDPRMGFLIRKSGINFVESRVGHLFIKKIMKDKNINFGAEYSGHYYFAFKFGKKKSYFDSGIFASLVFINKVSKLKKNNILLSQYLEILPNYYRSQEINFLVKNKTEVINKIKQYFLQQKPLKVSMVDGVRMEFKDYWFSLRQSNTENLLRLNAEAATSQGLRNIISKISSLIKRYKLS